ncbi:hypothetical protein VTJ49DRAFT_2553 [Mycothermus thermophilus]|uniref:MARVEL domain-containing protein n=1 Tax=Humicola insolens TaxID=85995 RepID=A0ABR3VMW6_HUMIN
MGTASKIALVLLRLGELACGAIILGIIGYFFRSSTKAGLIEPSGRLVYAAIIAALTILDSLLFIVPYAYSFWSFPLDVFFFLAWLVVFCVLITLTRTQSCQAKWYRDYWAYWWGWGRPRSPSGVAGCSAWRTVLAFAFVAVILYLFSALLGIYWTTKYAQMQTRSKGFVQRHTEQVKTLRKAKGTHFPRDVEAEGRNTGVVQATIPT